VNYLPRVGTSAVTGNFWKAFFLGLRMIRMITVARLKRPRLVIPRAPKRELETK
jgi:hypothetical protein